MQLQNKGLERILLWYVLGVLVGILKGIAEELIIILKGRVTEWESEKESESAYTNQIWATQAESRNQSLHSGLFIKGSRDIAC